MSFSREQQLKIIACLGKVSILVLVDVFLQTEKPLFEFIAPPVSILVLVDVFLQHGKARRRPGCSPVSILVLVDVFLQTEISDANEGPTSGFNPCFSGCLSPAWKVQSSHTEKKTVSILVLVDVFLQTSVEVFDPVPENVSILVLVDVFLQIVNTP